jgi:hypothetical protein
VRPEGAENLRENVEHHLHIKNSPEKRLLAFSSRLSVLSSIKPFLLG